MTGRQWRLLPGVLLLACGAHQAQRPAFTTRDSAGIRIVETNAPLWDSASAWTVDTSPLLSIGQADGADPYLLSRVEGAYRRDDGAVVLFDASSHQLREFDAHGTFVRAEGRRGPGPGEFGMVLLAGRCGRNQIWIASPARVSVWTLDLQYLREFTLTDNVMWPLNCLGGTGLIVKQDIGSDPDDAAHPANTIYPDSLQLRTVDSMGGARHDLMRIPLWQRLDVMDGRSRVSMIPPFGPVTRLAVDDSGFAMGFGERLEVGRYSRDGHLWQLLRGPVENLALTRAVRRAYETAELDPHDKETRGWFASGGSPYPKSIPAYTALIFDRDGNLWVQRFTPPGVNENRWGVFNRDGRFLGHVALPPGITVFEIGRDYILGSWTDSSYVEQIREYALHTDGLH